MMQLEFPLHRRTDPQTSRDAAANVDTFKAGHEAKIFDALSNAQSGLTYREIATVARLEPVAVARRLKGMERRKLVKRRTNGEGAYEQRAGMCVWRQA